jgi:hypothetical protein
MTCLSTSRDAIPMISAEATLRSTYRINMAACHHCGSMLLLHRWLQLRCVQAVYRQPQALAAPSTGAGATTC